MSDKPEIRVQLCKVLTSVGRLNVHRGERISLDPEMARVFASRGQVQLLGPPTTNLEIAAAGGADAFLAGAAKAKR